MRFASFAHQTLDVDDKPLYVTFTFHYFEWGKQRRLQTMHANKQTQNNGNKGMFICSSHALFVVGHAHKE